MDLSSHGRKRSSKDADDGSERDDERDQKRRMQSEKPEHAKCFSEKEKKDTATIETKIYTNTPEYDSVNLLPPLCQPSLNLELKCHLLSLVIQILTPRE